MFVYLLSWAELSWAGLGWAGLGWDMQETTQRHSLASVDRSTPGHRTIVPHPVTCHMSHVTLRPVTLGHTGSHWPHLQLDINHAHGVRG